MSESAMMSPSGGKWTEGDLEATWNEEMATDTMESRGEAGGVEAAVAHELGHAFASQVVGVDPMTPEGDEVSDQYSIEFQNAAADSCMESGNGCRAEH